MQKLTLQQKIERRKNTKPPSLLYIVLGYLWKKLYFKRLNVNVEMKIDMKQFKKQPYIVVSNHLSRLDYIYAGVALLPQRLNFVAGYNEFFRSHLAFILKILQVIPKKNFISDITAIKQIARVLKKKGKVIIFPEGMSSIGGMSQPVALGSGKMLKHFGVPVIFTKLSGGYLCNTKHCLEERAGRVDIVVDQLFTPRQLSEMTENEIQDKLNEVIRHDDYLWNKTARVEYDGHGEMAKSMTDYAYICPKCKEEYSLETFKNVIKCKSCGNGATINNCYDLEPLNENCVLPQTISEWWHMQRKIVHNDILTNNNFKLIEEVELGALDKFKPLTNMATGNKVGRGVITYNRNGLYYDGTRDGEKYSFFISAEKLPTLVMVTDMSFFQTYFGGEYLEFYPKTPCSAKWLFYIEENHRICGGKWQNYKDFDYNI